MFATITRLSLASLLTVACGATAAQAGHHDHHCHRAPAIVLPSFGFSSYNIRGYGERVVFVRCHSLAEELGLERGDTILAINDYDLTYHGSWEDGLRRAMLQGETLHFDIRLSCGEVVHRDLFLGGPAIGPVTPKSIGQHGPVVHYRKQAVAKPRVEVHVQTRGRDPRLNQAQNWINLVQHLID